MRIQTAKFLWFQSTLQPQFYQLELCQPYYGEDDEDYDEQDNYVTDNNDYYE